MLNTILAQSINGILTQILPFALIFVVIYFFMIRPQSKKQKELANFRNSLKVGDRVVTAGGIYGKIAGIKETHILLQVDTDTRIKVDKSSIIKDITDADNQK
ncbi:preprotein translocase subunit YajC [Halosquirtibacter xylanolyticus]|uniref:preprotein translocase subunit YajC n=1 Tax=Halosquirtibacter xylanolyticus TaxID=3374599 RepID=UPI0037499A88|nr:preprotein translocase subunit YajC [Prolixibacteraceae bacterium]